MVIVRWYYPDHSIDYVNQVVLRAVCSWLTIWLVVLCKHWYWVDNSYFTRLLLLYHFFKVVCSLRWGKNNSKLYILWFISLLMVLLTNKLNFYQMFNQNSKCLHFMQTISLTSFVYFKVQKWLHIIPLCKLISLPSLSNFWKSEECKRLSHHIYINVHLHYKQTLVLLIRCHTNLQRMKKRSEVSKLILRTEITSKTILNAF